MRASVLMAVLLAYWGIEMGAVRMWQSEAALFRQAWWVAPTDPRSALNYAKSLYAAGDDAAASRVASGARISR